MDQTLLTAPNLKSRSVHAFLWGGFGSLAKLVLQLGAQIILARVLGPEQYGLFAIGAIVISFSNFFSDFGIAYSLIQRQAITEQHIRYVFTWQVVIGTAVSLAIVGFAGPLADFFNEPKARSILIALAPLCLINATAAVSLNLLKRELDFKTIQIAQTTAYFVGYIGVGIPLALAGMQVWALVAAWVVQAFLNLAFLYWNSRHAARPLFKHADSRDMTRFGATVLATNLINWLASNIDRVVVARILAAKAVGLYATPYNLLYTPSGALMGIVQPVMYSACAKVQNEPNRIRNAYLTLVSALTLGVMPIFVAIAATADTIISALYGVAWAPAAEVLRPIALAMPLFLLWNITTPPLWTSGKLALEVKMQLPLTIIWLAATWIAAHYSLAAVAWTVLGLFFLRMAIFMVAAGQVIGVTLGEYLKAARGGLFLSLLIGTTAWGLDTAMGGVGVVNPPLRLFAVVLSCALVYILSLKFWPSLVSERLCAMIEQGVVRMPIRLARTVKWLISGVKNA